MAARRSPINGACGRSTGRRSLPLDRLATLDAQHQEVTNEAAVLTSDAQL